MILLSELPPLHHASRDSQTQLKKSCRSGNRQTSGTFQNLRRSAVCLNQDSDNVSLHSCRSRKQERIESDLRTGKSA